MSNLAGRLSTACARFAGRTALIDPEEQISYRAFASIAGQVAVHLCSARIRPDEPVIRSGQRSAAIRLLLIGHGRSRHDSAVRDIVAAGLESGPDLIRIFGRNSGNLCERLG